MNITSMLSSGYLQPSRDAVRPADAAKDAAALSLQEQQILAREKALKASSGPEAKVSTSYNYSVGPDGRRYISGATVSIEGGGQDGTAPGKADGKSKDVELGQKAGVRDSNKSNPQSEEDEENKKSVSGGSGESDQETEAAVRELKRTEREVIAHEAAHQAAGGGLAGGVSYSYTKGPDGKNYITGGEVPISMPVSDDPEETLRNMAKVQRAAMAPASPSGQDASVAGKAAAMAASARQELAAQKAGSGPDGQDTDKADKNGLSFASGVSSVKAGLLFGRLHGENYGAEVPAEEQAGIAFSPAEAYAQNASAHGMWTLRRGFEPERKHQGILSPSFNMAA